VLGVLHKTWAIEEQAISNSGRLWRPNCKLICCTCAIKCVGVLLCPLQLHSSMHALMCPWGRACCSCDQSCIQVCTLGLAEGCCSQQRWLRSVLHQCMQRHCACAPSVAGASQPPRIAS
jgi:hypothetical protein